LFLVEATRRLASSLEYELTLQSVARLAVPGLADFCAVDILDADARVQRVAVAHTDPSQERMVLEHAQAAPPAPNAPSGVMQVLRSGQPELYAYLADNNQLPAPDGGAEDLRALQALGLTSAMIVPMTARDRILGALTFAGAQPRRQYDSADLTAAEELAGCCALAVDNARLYRRARQAVEQRDAFLATVSHDLRNPLALIAAQAQLLRRVSDRDGGPNASRLGLGLGRIETTVARMTAMLDELVDVARLELGHQLELQRDSMDLVGLVRRKVAEYEQTTSRHLIRVAAETELFGNWDAARLERVLDNLLGNAIKYTPEGGVITVIIVRDDDDSGAYAVLSVRDSGVGIPARDLPRIFERFQRAGNVGNIGGSGIGLSVSRRIVEQHGGSISVDSTEGQGSVFTIRLPLA
jgi:signal transduction histidine kinase